MTGEEHTVGTQLVPTVKSGEKFAGEEHGHEYGVFQGVFHPIWIFKSFSVSYLDRESIYSPSSPLDEISFILHIF